MAKTTDTKSDKVFVKYIPRPGRPERMLIGNRFFNSNPRMEQSRYGDLIEVDFIEKNRENLEQAGCLIFDEQGVQSTIKEFIRNLAERRAERKEAQTAGKQLAKTVSSATETAKGGAEDDDDGPSPVPTVEEFVKAGYLAENYEHAFFGLKAGDPYDREVVEENRKKAAEAAGKTQEDLFGKEDPFGRKGAE